MFALGVALAELWASFGVRPDVLIGHSVGELTAACVAGALPLDEALAFVAERGRLMASLPAGGAMLSVDADEATVRPLLADFAGRLDVAAVNAPSQIVVSGDGAANATLSEQLAAAGLGVQALTVSHALHSPLMDPILDALEEAAARMSAAPPGRSLVQNLTGFAHDGAPTARYWREHARGAVHYAAGIRRAAELGARTFIELGPGSTLLALSRRSVQGTGNAWLPSLDARRPGREALLATLRALHARGHRIDWASSWRPATRSARSPKRAAPSAPPWRTTRCSTAEAAACARSR